MFNGFSVQSVFAGDLPEQKDVICPDCIYMGNNLYSLCDKCIKNLKSIPIGERIDITVMTIPEGISLEELEKFNRFSKNSYRVSELEFQLENGKKNEKDAVCRELLKLYRELEWFHKEELLIRDMLETKNYESGINRQTFLKKLYENLGYKAGYYFYNNDSTQAKLAIEQAFELEFRDPSTLYLSARIGIENNEYDQALNDLDSLKELCQNNKGHKPEAGLTKSEKSGYIKKALYLEKKIKGYKQYGKKSYDLYEKGWLYYSEKEYKKACLSFEQSLKLNPGFKNASKWLERAKKRIKY